MFQLAAEDKTVNRQEGCPLTFYGTGVNNTLSKSQMYNYPSRAYLKYNLGLLIWPDAQNLLYDNSASANLTGQETQVRTGHCQGPLDWSDGRLGLLCDLSSSVYPLRHHDKNLT